MKRFGMYGLSYWSGVFFDLWQNILTKSTILTILIAQFSSIKYSHIVDLWLNWNSTLQTSICY